MIPSMFSAESIMENLNWILSAPIPVSKSCWDNLLRRKEFRSSGVQEFRSSGVQEFRSSGVQEFRSSGVQEYWGTDTSYLVVPGAAIFYAFHSTGRNQAFFQRVLVPDHHKITGAKWLSLSSASPLSIYSYTNQCKLTKGLIIY
jgi:hypothetical protein